jgi:hypothetical protein
MKKAFIVTLASVVVATSACTSPSESTGSTESAVNGVPVGEIRGAVDVSNTLRSRLFDDTHPRTATFDIARVAGGSVYKLRRHLGTFEMAGTHTEYVAGTPAPLGVTLWHQVLSRFALAMGDLCRTGEVEVTFLTYANSVSSAPTTFRLVPSVAGAIHAVCTFEGDDEAHRQAASRLFDAVMGRGGSLAEEKAAFVTTFAANDSAYLSGIQAERVSAMFQAMLLNPHFLLQR